MHTSEDNKANYGQDTPVLWLEAVYAVVTESCLVNLLDHEQVGSLSDPASGDTSAKVIWYASTTAPWRKNLDLGGGG
jgi:hypothetical protein